MRWQGRMADDVAASRATVARALALLDSLPGNARVYKRDKEGKFSSGGPGSGQDRVAEIIGAAGDLAITDPVAVMSSPIDRSLQGIAARQGFDAEQERELLMAAAQGVREFDDLSESAQRLVEELEARGAE